MKEKLTKNKVLEISKDCLTTHDLYLKGKNVYEFVRRNNLWSEIPWVKRNETKPQKYWKNKENIDEYAKKCKTRKEFYKKNNSAYRSAIKFGWINEMTWLSNERKHKKGYWTNQKLFEECKKYKNRTELIKNNLVVYILLKKKKLLSNNLFNG